MTRGTSDQPTGDAPITTASVPDPQLLELQRALAGRFDVERLLGVGGMGSVYRARDVTLDRAVAIKIVNPEVALAPTVRARFLTEARTVARLRHPHIVAVHAAGEAEGLLYFVMEYVPGESLRERLTRDGRFDDRAAITALRDLARALGYAHAQGVVHRDVKPENVLLDREGTQAMLTDFGVAQALVGGGDGRLTGTGIVLGSPRYMSPEQVAGERTLDGRSDVYALGLVAYEMFAGEPAVTATTAATILVKHLTEKPTPITTRSARVTPALADVIDRALEKDPAARWATADAMADALEDVLAGWDGAPPRRAAVPRTAPAAPAARRRAWLAGGVLAAVVAMAAGWWAVQGRGGVPRGVDPRKSYLVAPFEVLSPDPQDAWLHDGSVSMLALNLAQWRDLQVVDYERALDLLRDLGLEGQRRLVLDDARRLARRAGVWTVVTGQITGTRDSLRVVARLWDVATGARVDEAQHSVARTADPRGLFDALARDLLQLAKAPATAVGLAQSTTSSVEAYRAYLDGSAAMNAWQLGRADSLFQRATALDSTFALAHYRRALTLGWGITAGEAQHEALRAARRHAARLPARERSLLDAYDSFAGAIRAQTRGDTLAESAAFVDAQRKYQAIVARDSGDAEAWYGLGDALWHHRPGGFGSAPAVGNWSGALRAFNRTLALDSSFHLAYSHKMDIYRMSAQVRAPIVLEGDSLRFLDAAGRRTYGEPQVAEAKRRAGALAVREARNWADADPVPQAYLALGRAYVDADQWDAAIGALDTALATHPALRGGSIPFLRAALLWRVRPEQALAGVRAALATADPATLASEGAQAMPLALSAAGVAAMGGSAVLADSVAAVAVRAQPFVVAPGVMPTAPFARWWTAVARLGMGAPLASVRTSLDSGMAFLDSLPAPYGPGVRMGSVSVPYLAYLASRDPRDLARLRRWQAPTQTPWVELDALAALAARDTARARALVRSFPSADSVRGTRGEMTALRWIGRAQVLEELGDARGALAMYEVLDPRRFTEFGLVDPGLPLYARSFLARGRLYEGLGDPARAAAAYERFLVLWRDADPAFDGQRREARSALVRLRDAAGARGTVPVRGG